MAPWQWVAEKMGLNKDASAAAADDETSFAAAADDDETSFDDQWVVVQAATPLWLQEVQEKATTVNMSVPLWRQEVDERNRRETAMAMLQKLDAMG
mmetsp:Transcript_5642/g.9098  ORF Transcript_5642/g.9098 Transcript_5642/m.9098 type:complete len:96 (-) Transcript_5642:76-363(-)